ncbi:hypothetical protein BBD42_05145 [Paenibacillus sp. BIHB 4019]|uniref:HTH araC/xylS-type domain-containing protein n=1 Tax=Paenibacillus sp. BIHB 4019 TaxID=1870819 RepID=A0A1B2DDX6_9BACL|nr:AraC family transcriptional regulator [Paenibacillus sp. BIHB 4019]ANY65921.1 hypothetical protein BBD42_05145 [Paenibacillus sp. BIHB 4019]
MDSSLYEPFHSYSNGYLNMLRPSGAPDFDPTADYMKLPEQMGSGFLMRTKLRPGMELIVADCRLHSDQKLRFHSTIPAVELSFWLNGSSSIMMTGQQLYINSCSSQLSFNRQMDAQMQCQGGNPILACEIRLAEPLFMQLAESFGGASELDFKRLLSTKPMRLFQESMNIQDQLHARELLYCPYVPAMRKMFLEGKALELLASYMQRHLFEGGNAALRRTNRLDRTDLDSLHAAAELLVHRMDDPPALPELARLVGLSEFKLKYGFRELYDTTVFGYLREKRMERALLLLRLEKVSVYEAAIATGYSNPSHFAAVFREKFGINPGKWKMQRE